MNKTIRLKKNIESSVTPKVFKFMGPSYNGKRHDRGTYFFRGGRKGSDFREILGKKVGGPIFGLGRENKFGHFRCFFAFVRTAKLSLKA
jgi:hypothetical protein